MNKVAARAKLFKFDKATEKHFDAWADGYFGARRAERRWFKSRLRRYLADDPKWLDTLGWGEMLARVEELEGVAHKPPPESGGWIDEKGRFHQTGFRNPRAAKSEQLFRSFHGYAPDHVEELPELDLGGPLVFLGVLARIDYDSPKWSRARPGRRRVRGYWHKSTGKPYVMATRDGRALVIVDPTGRLKVTAAGIEN